MNPLQKIVSNRRKNRDLGAKIAANDAELAELVQAAFEDGYTGPAIAEAANLSKERVYQIRDGRR